MGAVALTGNDTISINGQVLADLADGNVVELTLPNNISELKTGKNGNTVYAYNTTGQQAEVKVRVIRGSSDDQFLNNLLNQQNLNFAGSILLIGQFIKKIGDGQGNILSDIYVLGGGLFLKQVEGKSNVEGDIDQSVSTYMMKFASSSRSIG